MRDHDPQPGADRAASLIDRRSLMAAGATTGAALALGWAGARAQEAAPSLDIRWAFSIAIFFKERIKIASQSGRAFVPAVGGEIWGPRLSGRVVPYGGADYAGGHGLDAQYMLQADDGALIMINNHGYMKRLGPPPPPPPPHVPHRPGEPWDQSFTAPPDSEAPLRMRLAPVFDPPKGPHEWMGRTVFVGHGQRYTGPDHTIFTYYEVL